MASLLLSVGAADVSRPFFNKQIYESFISSSTSSGPLVLSSRLGSIFSYFLTVHCSKIAEAEAAVSVNEKKWLVMHMHVQLKLDELRGPPNPWLTVT
jgi:hypothetical protein